MGKPIKRVLTVRSRFRNSLPAQLLKLRNHERVGESKGLSPQTLEFIKEAVRKKKLSISGMVSLIYLYEFEKGRGIRYMEMRKRVMKEVDRIVQRNNSKK